MNTDLGERHKQGIKRGMSFINDDAVCVCVCVCVLKFQQHIRSSKLYMCSHTYMSKSKYILWLVSTVLFKQYSIFPGFLKSQHTTSGSCQEVVTPWHAVHVYTYVTFYTSVCFVRLAVCTLALHTKDCTSVCTR